MALRDWYANREVLLTGVTSAVGRTLLEKILRSFPDVKVHVVLRSRGGFTKDDRIRNILQTPRFERLRQECSDAASRIRAFEGNLLYERLALTAEDLASLKNVTVAFHAAGPHDAMFELCQELPRLEALASASSLFRHRGQITESLLNEHVPERVPLALVRIPLVGPAHREPMPGFVEILKGPSAFMVGAGLGFGKSELQAEVIPIDLAVNTLILAAWERANLEDKHGAVVYNATTIGCTWGDLIKKGQRANRKFAYPTFGIRGMTSIRPLHWILVLLLEWMTSLLCDRILALCGRKQRILQEYARVRNALRSLESISSRSWSAERNRVYQLQKRLSEEDKDAFPVTAEIDIESYILCAAASARKHCVDQTQITVVKVFRRLFYLLVIGTLLYLYFCSYKTTVKQRIEH